MAKTKSQTDAETPDATLEKKTAKQPSKKRETKKTAKKPVKKKRETKKKEDSGDAKSSAPAKKVKKAAKKAKKPTKKAKKPAKKAKKTAENGARAGTPPSKPRKVKEKKKVKATASVDQEKKEEAAGQTPESMQVEEMQWGRRSKRSGPIGWEDRAGVSAPVQPIRRQDAGADEAEVPAGSEPETPSNRSDKERNLNEKSDQNKRQSSSGRSRDEKPDQASRKLAGILAQSWTEDKTRRFLSEGFLGSLSAELVDRGKRESIPDAEMLKEPLQMIRKVLADECMVADDIADLLLLDVVMNALSDRIDVCRLQAESNALADIDVILELRYKADRRLIEAVNALKNA